MATTLRSGDVSICVRANTAARLFYTEEFGGSVDDAINTLMSKNPLPQQLGKAGMDYGEAVKFFNQLKSENPELVDKAIIDATEKGVKLDALLNIGQSSKFQSPPLPAFELMPAIWAMAKAEAYASGNVANFPQTYRDWLIEKADFDVNDCAADFEKEVRHGFFREDEKQGKGKRKK